MEGLASYGSDDDYEESPQSSHESNSPKSNPHREGKEEAERNISRDNYEDVRMDLSENEEDSRNGSSKSSKIGFSPSHTPPKNTRQVLLVEEDKRVGRSCKEERKATSGPSRSRSRSGGPKKSRRDKERDEKRRRRTRSHSKSRSGSYTRSDSKSQSKSKSRSPSSRRNSRKVEDKRDRDRERDKYRKDFRATRDSRSRNYRHRSRSRDRDSRESRDSRDSRRHRDRDYQRDSRDSRDCRDFPPRDRFSKRFERASNKLAHLEKMGIDVNKSQDKRLDSNYLQLQGMNQFVASSTSAATGEDRLLPPGVTGRLREQMERRKALWQKKPEAEVQDVQQVQPTANTSSGKVWQATTFAHDQEGKQANKFKRLMGIREPGASASDKSTDSLAKKQEELFSSMEQQYEVARTATHTMRGVGLGFGSYQR